VTLTIRPVALDDAGAIAAIYAPYVEKTVVSFEETPPTAGEMRERIAQTVASHPWIVGEQDGALVGYAYARPYHPRAAYRWTCETSIYLNSERRGRGAGKQLYAALLDILIACGFTSAMALISVPNAESTSFHEALGFRPVGRLAGVGYKLGGWQDVGYFQRDLAPRTVPPTALGLR
jgi:L-amino acid N-acyltransferase YncA